MNNTCTHPPSRHFALVVPDLDESPLLYVGCCDCGAVIVDGAPLKKRRKDVPPVDLPVTVKVSVKGV